VEGNAKLAPSPVRLPLELKVWLKHQAIDNRRSMNSEVVARLEESRTRQGAAQQPTAPKGTQ
jgi:hypothetical protein